ncbi:hypothetical protein AMECASPLE_026159 [Ameca splendens]|uniref:Uncharacterized protein n=1 Tax=Ameca splendens TaxID=208324 RepID=A0ABV0Z4F8_9TELE
MAAGARCHTNTFSLRVKERSSLRHLNIYTGNSACLTSSLETVFLSGRDSKRSTCSCRKTALTGEALAVTPRQLKQKLKRKQDFQSEAGFNACQHAGPVL